MTEDERAFLRQQQDTPADDDLRLVYADWLEEQGDAVSLAKAEFLRLTTQAKAELTPLNQDPLRRRLQGLAATLDPEWLAVASNLAIENCRRDRKAPRYGYGFEFLCDKRWNNLDPTDDPAVRFCTGCSQKVHYCDTLRVAREHAEEGHCIAIDLGVIRRKRDLEPEMALLGRPRPEFLAEEAERRRLDPVSEQREKKKEKAGKQT
jgi:uncharacterized protein (TIGR02996 family)